jgi:hypothetical protein
MRPRSAIYALCLLATLTAVACGSDDDSPRAGSAGSGGNGNAGAAGKGNAGSGGEGKAGSNGKAGGANVAGQDAGGSAGMDGGAAGDSGQPMGCTQLSEFVHSVIEHDTNGKSSPRSVNDVVFCSDVADPAAYDDLF